MLTIIATKWTHATIYGHFWHLPGSASVPKLAKEIPWLKLLGK